MTMQIGVGDVFVHEKGKWMIIDVKEKEFVCKNKKTGEVKNFDKTTVKELI